MDKSKSKSKGDRGPRRPVEDRRGAAVLQLLWFVLQIVVRAGVGLDDDDGRAGRCGGGDVLVLVEQAAGCAVSCCPVPFESGGRG